MRPVPVAGHLVDVLPPEACEKYLGWKFCSADVYQTELDNRLAAAWASFMKFKSELCNKKCPLRSRVRLFDAVVSPCVLYASSCWTLTAAMTQQLQTTRRRMMRWMLGSYRPMHSHDEGGRSLEAYVEHIQRTTRSAEALFARFGSTSWISAHRSRKWKLAAKIAKASDGRWSQALLQWIPVHGRGRDVGRPRTRWSDELLHFAGGEWQTHAADDDLWAALENGFIVNSA